MPTMYDLWDEDKGVIILCIDDKKRKPSVWLFKHDKYSKEQFYKLGARGMLVGKAKEMYEKRIL